MNCSEDILVCIHPDERMRIERPKEQTVRGHSAIDSSYMLLFLLAQEFLTKRKVKRKLQVLKVLMKSPTNTC